MSDVGVKDPLVGSRLMPLFAAGVSVHWPDAMMSVELVLVEYDLLRSGTFRAC